MKINHWHKAKRKTTYILSFAIYYDCRRDIETFFFGGGGQESTKNYMIIVIFAYIIKEPTSHVAVIPPVNTW